MSRPNLRYAGTTEKFIHNHEEYEMKISQGAAELMYRKVSDTDFKTTGLYISGRSYHCINSNKHIAAIKDYGNCKAVVIKIINNELIAVA